MPRILKF